MQQAWTTTSNLGRGTRSALVATVVAALLLALLPASQAEARDPYNRGIGNGCSSEARNFDPFLDRPSGTHGGPVSCIAFFGVTEGRLTSGGAYQYDPHSSVTREQMASFIARTINRVDGIQLSSGRSGAFPDSTGEHARNIDRLAGAEIVEGGSDGRFNRRGVVTREQMASFVARAIEYVTGSSLPTTDAFRNSGIASSHDDNVAKLARVGIVQGRSGNSYAPKSAVTRQEMASFLARTLDYLATHGHGLTPQTPDFVQVIGEFTTSMVPGESRNRNIRVGAEYMNGDVISPGQTYSLNQGIGPRTRSRGFGDGGAISGGEFITAVGGGVSQLATTLFNAAWFSGIELVSHQPHSQYIDRYPPGREATINWGTIDLRVRNDSPNPITIRTSTTDSSVTVQLIGTPWASVSTNYSGPSNPRSGQPFTASYSRTVTYPGGRTSSDSYRWTYQAG